MGSYIKTTYLFATTQLKRGFRDPMTVLILMGLPVILLLIFGAVSQSGGSVSLRTAIFNNSDTQFAKDFEKSLKDLEVLKLTDKEITLAEAKEQVSGSELDMIVEIPPEFGQPNEKGLPHGALKLFSDESDQQTNQIVTAIMNGVVDGVNQQLVGSPETPVTLEQEPISGSDMKPIDYVFSIFSGMALLMVGIFGVAMTLPTDKKTGILRRLHVTPLKASQVQLGTMLSFAVIGIMILLAMIAIAVFVFGMKLSAGELWTFIPFTVLGLVLMLGFGLAVAGMAKNTSQAEVIGQVIFLGSLGLSGVWFPIAAMPEFLQNIVAFAPLTPVIEGTRMIIGESATLVTLLPQLGIMAAWTIAVYVIGFKTFRWE